MWAGKGISFAAAVLFDRCSCRVISYHCEQLECSPCTTSPSLLHVVTIDALQFGPEFYEQSSYSTPLHYLKNLSCVGESGRPCAMAASLTRHGQCSRKGQERCRSAAWPRIYWVVGPAGWYACINPSADCTLVLFSPICNSSL